eukprot:gene16560-18237_t
MALSPTSNNSLLEFFNLTDGKDLKFAHAVNSQDKLRTALDDPTIFILEADVVMDALKKIPIMAHPPAVSSDLTLHMFLNETFLKKDPQKGIKLDFKQLEAIQPSLEILKNVKNASKLQGRKPFPILLNADILTGPNQPASTPVNATKFIELCMAYGSNEILSPGWTTKADNSPTAKGYSWEMVREMQSVIKDVTQEVTFPVRASLVAGTNKNGPLFLQPYSENPAMYQPLSQDEVQKIKKERKKREVQRKQKISENRKHLSNVRVIQKNLLFVVGLSQRLADAELLRKPDYFGKYGKILKVIVNPSTNYAGPQGPSASAYITYSKEEENLRAILAVNNIQQDGRTLRVSLGTTKYCTHFLRNLQCKNQDCMYLHEMGDDNACFTKDDMQQGKHLAYEKDLLENFRKAQLIRRKSQDLEQEIQSQKEDWGEETSEVNPNSALPAKAAWAGKDCEKGGGQDNEDEEKDHENSTPSPTWSSNSETPQAENINAKDEEDRVYATSITSSFPNSTSVASNFPNEIIHPAFATGWATSEETKPVDNVPSLLSESRNNSLPTAPTSWPLVSDLGLKNLQVTNDDDLGFDPFEECNKGLADLLASEGKPAEGIDCAPSDSNMNWNQMSTDPFANVNKETSNNQQYSLFGESATGSQPSSLFGSYLSMSSETNNSQSSIERIMSPDALFSSLSPTKQPSNQNILQNVFQKKEPDFLAWQDGLRALLPNVNISFSEQLAQNAQMNRLQDATVVHKPPWNDQGQTESNSNQNGQESPDYGALNFKRPPPGFVSPTEKSTRLDNPETVWTRFAKEEKLKKSSPPGLAGQLNFSSQVVDAKTVVNSDAANRPPATAWNAIVGRAQQSTQIKQQMQDGISHIQLATHPSKVGDAAKSAVKPVTAFSKVNEGQKSQKPTAKVKPQMKFIVAEEFPAVNAANPSTNIASGMAITTAATRSRMNDLDDISISDPLPLNRSLSGPVAFVIEPASSVNRIEIGSSEIAREKNVDENMDMAFQESTRKASKKKKKSKQDKQQEMKSRFLTGFESSGKNSDRDKMERNQASSKSQRKSEKSDKTSANKEEKLREPIKIQQRPKQAVVVQSSRPDQPKIRILKTEAPSLCAATITQSSALSSPMETVSKAYPQMQEGHEVFSRLAESTEKLLQSVLSETEVIKSNTEQISKDLKTALEKCKESSLSVADLEKINYLLSTPMVNGHLQGKQQKSAINTQDLERQVESARKEAEFSKSG